MGGSADRQGGGAPRGEDGAEAAPAALVQGEVERVTFHNEDSLYSVLRVFPERGMGDPEDLIRSRVTAIGRTPAPTEGLRVRLTGRWTRHRTHGRQFEFDLLEPLPPADTAGLVRYLASSVFPGVGETLAGRIVEELGGDALAVIQERPEALDGVKGLRPKVRDDLVRIVREQLGAHELHAFLLGVGLGPWQARAVARKLGPDAERQVRDDPFCIATGIGGIGFLTADRVARELGFAEDSPERLRAGLVFALTQAAGDGHALLPAERLIDVARELLGGEVAEAALREELDDARGELVVDDSLPRAGAGDETVERVYLPPFHASERGLADNLARLVASGPLKSLADAPAVDAAGRRANLTLHPLQRDAVLGLLSSPVSLLTGGPGVGKTTIVRLVVELAERAGLTVRLASPTGRAAKRLAESTGREASTVHRLLGYDAGTGGFAHDYHRALEAGLVVVDEVSMLDLVLAHHLLKAVQPPTRLVLVGDPDQLPSVSAGNVLGDMLRSGRVPTYRLTRIFRQDERSLIVSNAHRILHGQWPELPEGGDQLSDFYFFPADDELACADRVVDVVARRIPSRFGLDWVRDVQVLAPMYKGAVGVDELNERLREALGQGGRELHHRGRVWREGDRVIHTRNDYDKEVFNGDMGRVLRVERDVSGLVVRYPERDVGYRLEELSDLQPAFAITVHRSQGGEYPAIVLPLVPRHRVMLQRHLVYTAVTRARKLVVLVGSRNAIRTAIENGDQAHRESALAERLQVLLREPAE